MRPFTLFAVTSLVPSVSMSSEPFTVVAAVSPATPRVSMWPFTVDSFSSTFVGTVTS